MEKEDYKLILEVLETITVNPGDYQFGPAYESAKRNRKKAIKIVKQKLKELE